MVTCRQITRALSATSVGGMAGRLLRDAGAILGPAEVWAMLRAAIWALLLGMIVGVAAEAVERSRPRR